MSGPGAGTPCAIPVDTTRAREALLRVLVDDVAGHINDLTGQSPAFIEGWFLPTADAILDVLSDPSIVAVLPGAGGLVARSILLAAESLPEPGETELALARVAELADQWEAAEYYATAGELRRALEGPQ